MPTKKRTLASQVAVRGPLPKLPDELIDQLVEGPIGRAFTMGRHEKPPISGADLGRSQRTVRSIFERRLAYGGFTLEPVAAGPNFWPIG